METGTSGQGCTVLAVNAARGLLAFSLTGSPDRMQLVALGPAVQLTTLQQQCPAASCAYISAAVSHDGAHLLALCGPHEPHVELWALSPLQPLLTQHVQGQGTGMLSYILASCVGSISYREQLVVIMLFFCAGNCLSFHPSNSCVACSLSSRQAEVLCFDEVLSQFLARKAAVTAAAWAAEETITCHCWAPNGMLLLGTSAGRILGAEGKPLCGAFSHDSNTLQHAEQKASFLLHIRYCGGLPCCLHVSHTIKHNLQAVYNVGLCMLPNVTLLLSIGIFSVKRLSHNVKVYSVECAD